MVWQGVGVHGDEQGRALPLRDSHAVWQGDEHIPRPRQRHAAAAAGLQLFAEFLCGGEGHVLFVCAGKADGPRVLSAMPGVQHHQRQRRGCAAGRGARGDGGLGRKGQPGRDSQQQTAGNQDGIGHELHISH